MALLPFIKTLNSFFIGHTSSWVYTSLNATEYAVFLEKPP